MSCCESCSTKRAMTLVARFVVPIKLPTWNAVMRMRSYQQQAFKEATEQGFLFALQESSKSSMTMTTSARNSLSIAADTLDSFVTTTREKRRLKRASARRKKAKKNTSK